MRHQIDPATLIEACAFNMWTIDTHRTERSVLHPGPTRVPPTLEPISRFLAANIVEVISTAPQKRSLLVAVGEGEVQLRFRAQWLTEGRWACRLLENEVRALRKTGIPETTYKQLMNPSIGLTGGIVLFSGLPGTGKTTSASAYVRERLTEWGGYAITVEDPPELPLQGFVGEHGYIEQIDASEDGYAARIAESLRCFPAGCRQTLLYLGEIRYADQAAEAVRTALDGHTLISTTHAGASHLAVERLVSLAKHGGEPQAAEIVAQCLRMVVHQKMGPAKTVSYDHVVVSPSDGAAIAKGDFRALIKSASLSRAQAMVSGGGHRP